MRRAQAQIVAGLIVLLAVMVVLYPLLLQTLSSEAEMARRHSEMGSFQAERYGEKVSLFWLPPTDLRAPAFWLNNTGTVTVTLKYLSLVDKREGKLLYFINLSRYSPSASGPLLKIEKYPGAQLVSRAPLVLAPGEGALFYINRDYVRNYASVAPTLLSDRGVLHPMWGRSPTMEEFYPSVPFSRMQVIKAQEIANPAFFQPPPDVNYYDNRNPQVGVRSYKDNTFYYYTHINLNILGKELSPVYSIVIGLKPGSSEKFNLLIFYENTTAKTYLRAKIEGFVPDNNFYFKFKYVKGGSEREIKYLRNNFTDATGVYVFSKEGKKIDLGGYSASIRLSGRADSIKVFQRNQGDASKISSYDPFVIVADLDRNGAGELVFSTADGPRAEPQKKCPRDREELQFEQSARVVDGRVGEDLQWGFAHRVTNVRIDPQVHLGVHVTLRLFYYDSESEHPSCVDPSHLPLVKVMLVTSDWKIVDSRSVYFWEVALSEATWPPEKNFLTLQMTLFVPPQERRELYLVISLLDPFFGPEKKANDVDFALALELVGVMLINR
ncbi:MAG: hypothetical protein N3F67_02835 [Acidilobaceae archaeon]|nr:hypothetical protein [Acidilobaceae archaeon]